MQKQKQRLTYAQFQAIRTPGTVANLIGRYLMSVGAVRTFCESDRYAYAALQRMPIGAKDARALTSDDVIIHGRQRIEQDKVCAATVGHDIAKLSVVLAYAGSDPTWTDCKGITNACVLAAKPFMKANGLIAKSSPRERRPTDEEFERLNALFVEQNAHANTKIPMDRIHRWQRVSARRVGETCKLLWFDWNPDDQTIVVRGMKDPKRKNKVKVVALTNEAQAMLFELAAEMNEKPELRNDEPRIFPYVSKSVTQRYIDAKKRVGIAGLRLHDSRRDAGTNLVERDGYTSAQAILVTGHETPAVFERTYLRQNPAKFKEGPKGSALGR